MADDEDSPEGEEFDEEVEIEDEVPEDLDEDALDADFEEIDDVLLNEDGIADDDAVEEDEDEAEEAAPRRRVTEDEDEDEDMIAPDDVEADLDTILKDRLVTAEESSEDDEEETEVDDRSGDGDRLQPKRADEQLCPSCFLLVRRNAPGCPVGDDACPLFT